MNDYLKLIFTKHILVALYNRIIQKHVLHKSDKTIKNKQQIQVSIQTCILYKLHWILDHSVHTLCLLIRLL